MTSSTHRSAVLALALLLAAQSLTAYPLDGWKTMGIRRLLVHQNVQGEKVPGPALPPGALLGSAEIRLWMAGRNPGWELGEMDPVLKTALASIFEGRDPSYGVAVIDVTDPEAPSWAGINEERTTFPGSVGKIVTMAALFDALRQAYPEIGDRRRILQSTVIEADAWALGDWHPVPTYDAEAGVNRSAPVQGGERFSLAEWIDHMISASANSAGAIVWREAMLLRKFGSDYPVPRDQAEAFFRETPKQELSRRSLEVSEDPLRAAGLDLGRLRQGTFWTKHGQARIPGISSYASPRELARFLLRIEQGRLVDSWSSMEMKRFLYKTRRRYRYAYAPELHQAALYFKSGSFYRCAPEEGYRCRKYAGNVENRMNSVVIVENPAEGGNQRRYIVALTSNVLRKNSAWDHARIAAAIDEAVRTREKTKVREQGTQAEIEAAGSGG